MYRKRERLKVDGHSPKSITKKLVGRRHVSENVRKTLTYHHALVRTIKENYHGSTSEKSRQIISQIVSGRIIRKYRFQAKVQETLGLSRKRFNQSKTNNDKLAFQRKKYASRVCAFYNRDDVSRLTAGKSQTVTKMKEKKQKRFLCDNVRNLHKRFLIENPATEISYSLFCRMKPFSVVTPTNTDRETCLCKVHENIKFLVEKLRHHKVIDSTNLESIVEATCCSIEKKECMYGDCDACKNKEVQAMADYDPEALVSYPQWTTEMVERRRKSKDQMPEKLPVRVTIKKVCEITLEGLLDLFANQLTFFKKHLFSHTSA